MIYTDETFTPPTDAKPEFAVRVITEGGLRNTAILYHTREEPQLARFVGSEDYLRPLCGYLNMFDVLGHAVLAHTTTEWV